MKKRATDIKYIVIHCSAGFGDRKSIERYWKSIGWTSAGYKVLINPDGTREHLADYDDITNGVKGFNSESIHICYIGGVDPDNVKKAKDTRTDEQKEALLDEIYYAINWLKSNGKDVTKDLMILGHRDFSDDLNKNGMIDSGERIKECPSFDAIAEYGWITGTQKQTLPKNRKI